MVGDNTAEAIAGYRIIRELGAGGMGQMFLVQHPRLPRRDALKLLDVGVSRDDGFKARFIREADLLAGLSHPNIVTLFDRGEFEGRFWITMEFVDGTDAAELLKADGPLDVDLAVQLVAGAGAALDYVWRKQRITHRDVKPANILVGIDPSDGAPRIESVKLADFGIAKAAGESTSLTSTGTTIGTMSYISPEAIEGHPLDCRADVYSLGCTAFHLLTGRVPFAAGSVTALMSAHLTHAVPAASAVAPHLPRAVDSVFERVLAKRPGDRYGSCSEFVDALRSALRDQRAATVLSGPALGAQATLPQYEPTLVRVQGGHGVLPPPQRSGSTGRLVAVSGAVLAVVVAVVGLVAFLSRGDGAVPAPATVTVPATAATTTTPPTSVARSETTETPRQTATTTTTRPIELGRYCPPEDYGKISPDGTLECSPMNGGYWKRRGSDG